MNIITKKDYQTIRNYQQTIKNYDTLYELLLKNLKNEIRCSKTKGYTTKRKSWIGLKFYKFIEFNSKTRQNFIILDFDYIDKINRKTVKSIYNNIYSFKMFLSVYLDDNYNFIVETEKGYQVFILLNLPAFNNNKNHKDLIKHIKQNMINQIPYIDPVATMRSYGIWRNPLLHNNDINSLEGFNLENLSDFISFENEEINYTNVLIYDEMKKEIKRNEKCEIEDFSKLKEIAREVKTTENYNLISLGNRNTILWILAMVKAKEIKHNNSSKFLYSILNSYLIQINSKINESLELIEIEHICKSVVKYTIQNKNFIILHEKKTRKEINADYWKNKSKGKTMTRTENAKKISKEKEKNYYKKIVNLITGIFADNYKKKNGKWNYKKIAAELKINYKTVSKHIKKFETEKQ